MGTALVLVATAAAVFYVAQTHRKYLAMAVAATLILGLGAILAKPYRVNRMIKRLDPQYTWLSKIDPSHRWEKYGENGNSVRDPNYQGLQSRIAVATGGPLGQGLMRSKQKLLFLPEVQTDFIYAVTAENTGFAGCVLVLLAYVVLLSRLITGARRASDRMGMLFIMSFVGGLTFQIFINIGMALGISPVIGVPLPLMSAGLASLSATFIAIGFAISVQLRRFVN